MSDPLYWTARVALVGLWLAVAVRAAARRRARPVFWLGCAAAAGVFASLRAWPWNYVLLVGVRGGLQQAGVYDDRIVFKLLLAGALLATVALGAKSLRRLSREPAAFGCCLGLGLQGVLLAIETLSLDEMVPQCFVSQPWRYLEEGVFAACALWALRSRPEVR